MMFSMSRYISLLLSLNALFHSTTPQIFGWGKCPPVDTMENFEIEPFLGVWYVVRQYPFWLTIGAKCTIIVINANDGNNTVTGDIMQMRFGRQTSTTIVTKSTKKGFKTLRIAGLNSVLGDFELKILYTDYNEIAITYMCVNILGFGHTTNVWVMSRSRHQLEHTFQKANEVFKNNSIVPLFMIEADHSTCPEFVRLDGILRT